MIYSKSAEAMLLLRQLGITGAEATLERLGYRWSEEQRAWLTSDGRLALKEHTVYLEYLMEVYA